MPIVGDVASVGVCLVRPSRAFPGLSPDIRRAEPVHRGNSELSGVVTQRVGAYTSGAREGGVMAKTEIPDDIAKMSFEDALKTLEDIVRELESGEGKLDGAIASYERGALLKRHCEAKLKDAQQKVDKIVAAGDGTLGAEPADDD